MSDQPDFSISPNVVLSFFKDFYVLKTEYIKYRMRHPKLENDILHYLKNLYL